ncbi:MAG: hypothetical protein ABSC20_05660 [Candidatus Bathyarchaeia archaeon]
MRRHLDVEIIDPSKRTQPNTTPPASALISSQLLERPSINKMEEWLNQTGILQTLGIEGITNRPTLRRRRSTARERLLSHRKKHRAIFRRIEARQGF